MQRGKGVHTVPNPNGPGWLNELDGVQQGRVQTYKITATTLGRKLAQRLRVEHTIHHKNGRIGAKNSYGHDPRNVKG